MIHLEHHTSNTADKWACRTVIEIEGGVVKGSI